jgi:hypothetical protein
VHPARASGSAERCDLKIADLAIALFEIDLNNRLSWWLFFITGRPKISTTKK